MATVTSGAYGFNLDLTELVEEAFDEAQAVVPAIQGRDRIVQNLPRQSGDFGRGNVGEVCDDCVEGSLHR